MTNRGEKPSESSYLSGRRIPSLAALLLVVCVLLVFNLSNSRMLQLFSGSKEQDLVERLRSASNMIIRDLKTPRAPAILTVAADRTQEDAADVLSDLEGSRPYHNLVERLLLLQSLTGLSRVDLLTTGGLVIADSLQQTPPGESYIFGEFDRNQLAKAQMGHTDDSPLYYYNGQPFKRFYMPIVLDGRVAAVLSISISAEYVTELETIRKRVRFQSLINSALLLIIGISIFRVFSYLVRVERSAMLGARVEAMGAMAAGVAHELRNPLSIIRMLCEEIVSEQPPESRAAVNARDILDETERLNEMVRQFLSMSRPVDSQPGEAADIRAEIQRVSELVRKGGDTRARILVELPEIPLFAAGEQRALRQVLLNLLINAHDALPKTGGWIRVRLQERRGAAEIQVSDNGQGIPKRDISRVFEPFYTTKKSGTGLGLPISRSIVENLGGELHLTSTPGKGTTVTIRIPLAEAPAEVRPEQEMSGRT